MLDVEQVPGAERVSEDIGVRAELVVDFGEEAAASEYERALVSLAGPGPHEVILRSGKRRTNTSVEEILQRMDAGLVARTRLTLPGELRLEVERDGASVKVRLPFTPGLSTGRIWLQCSIHHITRVPILSLSTRHQHLTQDALNALVGLASHFHDPRGARLDAGDYKPVKWATDPFEGALPVLSQVHGSVWTAVESSEVPELAEVKLWVERTSPPRAHPDEGWWTTFDRLAASPRVSLEDVRAHLDQVFQIPVPWRIGDIHKQPHPNYAFGPEEGVVSSLVPKPDEVILAADLDLPPASLAEVLLHACAHLELGHVMPGDEHAHWDTLGTATSTTSHRQWDKCALSVIERYLKRPRLIHRSSLEECTPKECVQLGLHRMIGEVLGESQSLHAQAIAYQNAAYQRQAAQRLVAQLESFGGSMLCDGVGLGKTYVATTVMVHYANLCRTKDPDDIFRITVLAPHSVVGTWQREAIRPLTQWGVNPQAVRVLSHTALSRVTGSSGLIARCGGEVSDFEHLALSDLVVVDEAHNFRSVSAKRTRVLREVLRMQPRQSQRRKVLLLTATPINNSLEDLVQEISLMFSTMKLPSAERDEVAYRTDFACIMEQRATQARTHSGRDVAGLLIYGDIDKKPPQAVEFDVGIDFGSNILHIGTYLKAQNQKLQDAQLKVRDASEVQQMRETQVRVAEDLLDRIVVQRSRELCKEIERLANSNSEILFRPPAGPPSRLYYSDEYDGIKDVLARFLPLFDDSHSNPLNTPPLSLKVHMWYDVRKGIRAPSDHSSVVGLQRILVLKRLESSPVAFLLTLVRLTVLHAHRLNELLNLAEHVGDAMGIETLGQEYEAIVEGIESADLDRISTLTIGRTVSELDFITELALAHSDARPVANSDDTTIQTELFEEDSGTSEETKDEYGRLWQLREDLLRDFRTLLAIIPELADIVFGRFEENRWPKRFLLGGEEVDWPENASWGHRLISDAKLFGLFRKLIEAQREGKKSIVFSQFGDSLAYVNSVLRATRHFEIDDWREVLRAFGIPGLKSDELIELLESVAVVTGQTESRDEFIDSFAPYYRIGPIPPHRETFANDDDWASARQSWSDSWRLAIERPIDVLLATDVLAEGVNLQDAAQLINFDVHWNPVRMIQRAGRIDRRLNPIIEQTQSFQDLDELSADLGSSTPKYYWHSYPHSAPKTINMILPDELEKELLLRERIAFKTLAIDFTLGLEQGTGAEADWMAAYKYQGISSLNAYQRDRAIEQIASEHEKLAKYFRERGIDTNWASEVRGWFRTINSALNNPMMGRISLSATNLEPRPRSRFLTPVNKDEVPHILVSQPFSAPDVHNFWIALDSSSWPPKTRIDLPWFEGASQPVGPRLLRDATNLLWSDIEILKVEPAHFAKPLQQALAGFAAGSVLPHQLTKVRFAEYFVFQGKELSFEESGDINA